MTDDNEPVALEEQLLAEVQANDLIVPPLDSARYGDQVLVAELISAVEDPQQES